MQTLTGRVHKRCGPFDNIQLVGLLMHRLPDSCVLMWITVSRSLLLIAPWCLYIMLLSQDALHDVITVARIGKLHWIVFQPPRNFHVQKVAKSLAYYSITMSVVVWKITYQASVLRN